MGKETNPWLDEFLDCGKLKPVSSIVKGVGIAADIKQIREHDLNVPNSYPIHRGTVPHGC